MTKRASENTTPKEVIRQWFRSKCERWHLDNDTRATEAILAELDAAGFVIVAKANVEEHRRDSAALADLIAQKSRAGLPARTQED